MRPVFPRLGLAFGASLCVATAALAETEADVVARMHAEGYSAIEVSTTWLRRTRIVAEGPPGLREVVIDPRNGEILRDFSEPPAPPDRPPPPGSPPPGFPPADARPHGGGEHPSSPIGPAPQDGRPDHGDPPAHDGGRPGGPGGPGAPDTSPSDPAGN